MLQILKRFVSHEESLLETNFDHVLGYIHLSNMHFNMAQWKVTARSYEYRSLRIGDYILESIGSENDLEF